MGTHPIFESDFDCLTVMLRLPVRRIITSVEGSPNALKNGALFTTALTTKAGQLSKASVTNVRHVAESFKQNEKYVVINELNFDADRDVILDQLKSVDIKVMFNSDWLTQIGIEYGHSIDQLLPDELENLTALRRTQLMLILSDWMFMAEHHNCSVQIFDKKVKEEWLTLACSKMTSVFENQFAAIK